MKNEDICGKCYYHRKHYDEWCCNNPESECYGCATEYNDYCEDFEERNPRTKFSVEILK